jgi:hypothetical protein
MTSALCVLVLLLFFTNVLLSAFLTGIHALLVEVFHHLVVVVLGSLIHLPWQQSCQYFQLFRGDLSSFGHYNLESDN